MSTHKYDYLYNILILGGFGVGKTSLLGRYTDDSFVIHSYTTDIDFKIKIIKLSNGKLVKLRIWDTGGYERLRPIIKTYINRSDGIILLYDVTDLNSFKYVNNWINFIRANAQRNLVVYLVGTKIDKKEERKVTIEEGEIIAEKNKCLFAEVSSKTGYNVNEIFQDLVERIHNGDFYFNVPGKNVRQKLNKFIDY